MRIFFIGTVDFSETLLSELIEIGSNIVGVATKAVSRFNADHTDLSPICEHHKIPWMHVDNINDAASIKFISKQEPDVVFCFGWSQIIKSELLNLTSLGVIGYHPAALPANRGRHPIIWALALGLEKTASTFFFMDEGADSGDILSQVPVEIDYEDDAGRLYEKLKSVARNQIREFVPQLSNRSFKRIKQDDSKSNLWRKRGKQDGVIHFNMTSKAIYDLVRALTSPYVGAHVVYNNEEVKVWHCSEVEISGHDNIEPGKVLSCDSEGGILVKCYGGAVRLIDHDFKDLPKVGSYLI